jgi:hypothetical protein
VSTVHPRITFGIIVLNGEPFTLHTLRALYPFAHQIIVVEGAVPGAHAVARSDGHSRDGTLARIRQFMTDEDPDRKVQLVTAEDEGHADGWWPGEKDEQSRAYAQRATGDYLWQVDIDEFYLPADMQRILNMLAADPTIDAMSFEQVTFWGGLRYWVDSWYLRRGARDYHRLFRWGPGFSYTTHRPPTVQDEQGRNLRDGHWITPGVLAEKGIRLYHYSLLLPRQVADKCAYYANAAWARRPGATAWAEEVFGLLQRPYRAHNVENYPGWLNRYEGPHPPEIQRMVADLQATDPQQLRPTGDIERLLAKPSYRVGCAALRMLDYLDRRFPVVGRHLPRVFR